VVAFFVRLRASSALHQGFDLCGTREYRFITLGSCRFLDGLVVEESVEVRKKIVRGSGFRVVRGVVLTSRSGKEQL
jgi:hypothetical protein